jgi:hypothetical protein
MFAQQTAAKTTTQTTTPTVAALKLLKKLLKPPKTTPPQIKPTQIQATTFLPATNLVLTSAKPLTEMPQTALIWVITAAFATRMDPASTKLPINAILAPILQLCPSSKAATALLTALTMALL